MAKVIQCPCGTVVHAEDEEDSGQKGRGGYTHVGAGASPRATFELTSGAGGSS
jgi:hypothetical protein